MEAASPPTGYGLTFGFGNLGGQRYDRALASAMAHAGDPHDLFDDVAKAAGVNQLFAKPSAFVSEASDRPPPYWPAQPSEPWKALAPASPPAGGEPSPRAPDPSSSSSDDEDDDDEEEDGDFDEPGRVVEDDDDQDAGEPSSSSSSASALHVPATTETAAAGSMPPDVAALLRQNLAAHATKRRKRRRNDDTLASPVSPAKRARDGAPALVPVATTIQQALGALGVPPDAAAVTDADEAAMRHATETLGTTMARLAAGSGTRASLARHVRLLRAGASLPPSELRKSQATATLVAASETLMGMVPPALRAALV